MQIYSVGIWDKYTAKNKSCRSFFCKEILTKIEEKLPNSQGDIRVVGW